MNEPLVQTPSFAEALASGAHWLIVWICVLLVASVVGIHYEALDRLNQWLPRLRVPARRRLKLPSGPNWRVN